MKKVSWYILAAVIFGLIGSVARGYELAFGFDMMSGLPTGMAWITGLLLAVGAVFGVVCLLLVKNKVPEVQEDKKSIVHTAVSLLCAALMRARAGYSL